jgi:hypothetical protein
VFANTVFETTLAAIPETMRPTFAGRRAGKTTLVRKMDEESRRYITLDDQTVLAAAQSDPAGFVRGLDRVIIDEIQRAPELLRNRCSGPTLPSPS